MRAVAILLVIAFHIGLPGVPGGFVGVDVFFVISGFLITGFVVRARQQGGVLDLTDFYARRVRRLLPAGWLVLIAAAAVSLALPPGDRHPSFLSAALSAAGYVSNLHFINAQFDYFDAEVGRNPLLHTWSLGVEAQFYLLWPLLLGWVAKPGKRLWIAIAVVLALSLAASILLTPVNPAAAYFGLPTRAWQFAAGGLLAAAPQVIPPRLGHILGAAGLAVIVATAALLSRQTLFPGWAAIWPVIGACAVISGARGGGPINRLLGSPPFQAIGKVSYGWYLWHWPMLIFAAVLAPGLGLGGRAAVALAALGVAALSYRFVETPIRRSRALASRPWLSLALGAVGVAFTMLTVSLLGMTP